MESQSHIIELLQLMDRPAFCVCGGIILGANQAALNHFVPVEQPILPLLVTGQDEYAHFSNGWLYLTLDIGGSEYSAEVHRVDEYHIFTLEPENTRAELQVLALAAQELRTPLSNIMATTDLLFPSLDQDDGSSATQQMARINRGLHQLLRIVSNMSDAARYSTSPPRKEAQNVDALLRELFDQAAPLCELTGVSLEYTGLSSPVYSLIDQEQLERSIYHILSNSLKSTPAGGFIRAKLTRGGNTLHLTIQDTGSGLSEHSGGNPFDRFLREPSVTGGSGIGLGLHIIRTFAAAHGGTVLLTSPEGSGLRLLLTLPIRLGESTLHTTRIDYAGERNHGLIELSDSLPPEIYKPNKHS